MPVEDSNPGASADQKPVPPAVSNRAEKHAFRLSRLGGQGLPILKKVMELGSGNMLNAALSAILGIYVSRVLGPSDKGILALISGSSLLMAMVFSFGASHAAAYYVRKRAKAAHAILKYMNLTQLTGLALCAGLVFLSQDAFSRWFLDGNRLDSLSLAFMVLSIFTGLGIMMFGSCVIAKGESRAFATIGLAGTLANIALCWVLLILLPYKLHAVLAGGCAGQVLTAVLYRLRYSRFLPASEREPLRWQEFFLYGSRVQIGSLSNLFFKRADLFVIGYFLDTRAVGFYSIGLGLRELATIIPRSLVGIIGGELADSARGLDRKMDLLKRALLGALAFSFLLAVASTLIFPFIIPALYSHAFAGAVAPAILIMWSFIPISLSAILGSALTSDGKPLIWSLGNVFSAIVSGVLVWTLTRYFGLAGSAVAAILGASSQLIVCSFIFLRYSSFRAILPARMAHPFRPRA